MGASGELGNPYLLDRRHRVILYEAARVLATEWLDDYCAARHSGADHIPRDGSMAMALPPKHWGRYTADFAARFIRALHIVTHRLADPTAREPYFNSTAEELAFAGLVDRADPLGDDADFETYRDLMTDDADIELLWDMSLDGVEEAELGHFPRPVNLAFERWFVPFRPGVDWVNPLEDA